MQDRFYKICTVFGLVLLCIITFNLIQLTASGSQPVAKQYPYARNPVYKVIETDVDATEINAILTKYGNEGAFQLAAAPIVKSDHGEKLVLILVQHW